MTFLQIAQHERQVLESAKRNLEQARKNKASAGIKHFAHQVNETHKRILRLEQQHRDTTYRTAN